MLQLPRLREMILTDGILESLAKHQKILAAFPFVRITTKTVMAEGCNGCARRRQQRIDTASDSTRIKQQLVNLDADSKERLKALLAVDSLVLFLNTPNGVKRHSF